MITGSFLIEAAGTGLFLHAYGGSKDGMEIVLHGDQKCVPTHTASSMSGAVALLRLGCVLSPSAYAWQSIDI